MDDGGRRACARDDACANARVRIKEISLYILTRRSRARRRVNAAWRSVKDTADTRASIEAIIQPAHECGRRGGLTYTCIRDAQGI